MTNENLLIKDYEAALQMQYACNSSGIILALAEIMPRLNYTTFALGKGLKWRDEHPILRLIIHQLSSLCGNGESMEYEDYARCSRFAKLVASGRIPSVADYATYTGDDLAVLSADRECSLD